jgi:hypothetical protein
LTSANPALSGYTGPYGSVSVTTSGTTLNPSNTATITFTANTAGGFVFVDGSSAAVNVNATNFSISNISGTNYFSDGKLNLSNGGSSNVDGFQVLNQTVDNQGSFKDSLTTISFTITESTATWTSASDVLTANSNGALVAAHIAACTLVSGACNEAAGALATGYTANTGAVNTPLPGALALFGSVLVGGLGLTSWRKRRSRGPVSVIA